MKRVGELCEKYNALFHCDSTQTMAHYKMDLQSINVHMVNGAAHKFHGPKGIGVLYVRKGTRLAPFMLGGHQEAGRRVETFITP